MQRRGVDHDVGALAAFGAARTLVGVLCAVAKRLRELFEGVLLHCLGHGGQIERCRLYIERGRVSVGQHAFERRLEIIEIVERGQHRQLVFVRHAFAQERPELLVLRPRQRADVGFAVLRPAEGDQQFQRRFKRRRVHKLFEHCAGQKAAFVGADPRDGIRIISLFHMPSVHANSSGCSRSFSASIRSSNTARSVQLTSMSP